jgi:hypothetical protein
MHPGASGMKCAQSHRIPAMHICQHEQLPGLMRSRIVENIALHDRYKYNTVRFSYVNRPIGVFHNASDRFPA